MFSRTIERAIAIAIEAHDGQVRRGDSQAPYVVHPLHVALMLARFGLEEDVIVAGLLHDVVEDCEDWTCERVEDEFGIHLASIVAELTEDKQKDWEERKRACIDKVARMSPQAATVTAFDKLHNLHNLVLDLRAAESPELIWRRFRGGREGTLRVTRELIAALRLRVDPRIARALESALQAVLDEDPTAAPARV